MTQAPGDRSSPRDRVTVARTVSDLVLGVTGRYAATGVSIVIEGPPGIGKTFLVRQLLNVIPPNEATILHVAGDHHRRNDPFAGLAELLGELLGEVPDGEDPGEAAFARVAAAIKDRPGGHTVLELVFSAVIPVVILIYKLKFSKSYPERVSHAQSQPAT